jgi:RimJ/RimL family protein N-acetyltransferase
MSTAPRDAPFPRELTTDRLRLVAADATSLDPFDLYEHCGEGAPDIDEVTRYLTWGPYGTVNEAFEFLERCESRFDEGEAAHYAVFVDGSDPESGAFAGMAGLTVEWDRRLATLGTWFRKRFWGRGYSGERARALMRVAFDRLDLDAVAAHFGADDAAMADPTRIRETVGWSIGGVPPLCHDAALPTVFDPTLAGYDTVYGAAGTPSAVFAIAPDRLASLAEATTVDLTE